MVVLVTCKNEEDPMKIKLTTLYSDFLRSMTGNSAVSGRIWLKFKLIQAFMHALLCCKNEEDPIENEDARVLTTFLPL